MDETPSAPDLPEAADRLDELAEVAELMGDDAGALRFRNEAARCRERAMRRLDPPSA